MSFNLAGLPKQEIRNRVSPAGNLRLPFQPIIQLAEADPLLASIAFKPEPDLWALCSSEASAAMTQ